MGPVEPANLQSATIALDGHQRELPLLISSSPALVKDAGCLSAHLEDYLVHMALVLGLKISG